MILRAAVMAVIIAAFIIFYFALSTRCILLTNGDTGEILGVFPISPGDEFSVSFIHSVNKTPVTDVFEVREGSIYAVRTIYYSFGAGVQTEIEEGQTLDYGEDGSMIVSGIDKRIDKLSYIVGTVSDHILEIKGQAISLRELCGKNTVVRFSAGRRLFVK